MMYDPQLLATLPNKIFLHHPIKGKQNIQTLIYTFKTTVIQSKSIEYLK